MRGRKNYTNQQRYYLTQTSKVKLYLFNECAFTYSFTRPRTLELNQMSAVQVAPSGEC